MVSQNGQQPRPQQSSFPSLFSQGSQGTLDPSFIDSPQAPKNFTALSATNQARASQNSRPVASSAGTSSGPFGAPVNPHSYSSGAHDLLGNSTNGHTNFPITNNFGLGHNPSGNVPFLDQGSMTRSGLAMKDVTKQRESSFLQGLATTHAKSGCPLPPALTGIAFPNYDPTNRRWNIEPGSEIGTFRIVGKDVSLFKFWGLAMREGGVQNIENANAWPAFLPHFGLPEEYVDPQTNVPIPVAKLLREHYMDILVPFERMYRMNLLEQQKRLQMSQNQAPSADPQFLARQTAGASNVSQGGARPMSSNGITPQSMAGTNGLGQFLSAGNQQRPALAANDSHSSLTSDLDTLPQPVDTNLLDQDILGIKRKLDSDSMETKRVRQKTDPPDSNPMVVDAANNVPSRPDSQPPTNVATNRPRRQPMRRKIEYIPLAREVDTYGGRDVHAIDAEWTNQMSRRLLRDIHEWGTVDTEHLSMSLRSRLAIELSYALTTFTVLSTMRAQTPGSGFPIVNCPDLLDDALDLMEDNAFGGPETTSELPLTETSEKIYTNRELVALVQETEGRPFASLEPHQGSKNPSLGPMPRPGNIVISVVAIVRNLSIINDNVEFLASFPRLADRLLRLCILKQSDSQLPTPLSQNMSLADLLLVRRETMFTFVNLAGFINLSALPSSTSTRIARRILELIASYLVDPIECVPPLASVQLSGVPPNSSLRPPALADMALEVFTRISQSDVNRQFLARAIPQRILWQLVPSLVHRVPMIEADFLLMQRDYWQSYVEKTIMGIYSLIFMAPYELKQKIKADKSLGIKTVLLRMAQRVLLVPNHDGRGFFVIPARRAVEAMKLLDKAEEKVDVAEPEMPALQFGMGFTDGDDNSLDKGTGLLGANKDVAWEMLMMREVFTDEIFFNELDSLVRVDCP